MKSQKNLYTLENLASPIEIQNTWDDLRLPKEKSAILHELIVQIRRKKSKKRFCFSNRGTLALFTGPGAKNKSIAIECIASDLGQDVYRIDLAAVVNKYIGETEKNLQRLFARSESLDIILFFDEADALFGKRTDVKKSNNRYANQAIKTLFERIKAYRGVVILSTNSGNISKSPLKRRLKTIVDFPDDVE